MEEEKPSIVILRYKLNRSSHRSMIPDRNSSAARPIRPTRDRAERLRVYSRRTSDVRNSVYSTRRVEPSDDEVLHLEEAGVLRVDDEFFQYAVYVGHCVNDSLFPSVLRPTDSKPVDATSSFREFR